VRPASAAAAGVTADAAAAGVPDAADEVTCRWPGEWHSCAICQSIYFHELIRSEKNGMPDPMCSDKVILSKIV